MAMSKTTRAELTRLAKMYTERARPVLNGAGPEIEDPSSTEMEVRIRTDLYDQVLTMARENNQTLAAVARAVLFRAAARAKPNPELAARPRPELRPYNQDRRRLRVAVPTVAYDAAADAIRESGQSMTRLVEDGLRDYVRLGRL
jgi:hypothetical protein